MFQRGRGGRGRGKRPAWQFAFPKKPSKDVSTSEMTSFQFDESSPGAQRLQQVAFKKIKKILAQDLNDPAIAQYTIILVARGTDKKKIQGSLASLMGEEPAAELLEWLYKHLRMNYNDYFPEGGEASTAQAPASGGTALGAQGQPGSTAAPQKSSSLKSAAVKGPERSKTQADEQALGPLQVEEHPLLASDEEPLESPTPASVPTALTVDPKQAKNQLSKQLPATEPQQSSAPSGRRAAITWDADAANKQREKVRASATEKDPTVRPRAIDRKADSTSEHRNSARERGRESERSGREPRRERSRSIEVQRAAGRASGHDSPPKRSRSCSQPRARSPGREPGPAAALFKSALRGFGGTGPQAGASVNPSTAPVPSSRRGGPPIPASTQQPLRSNAPETVAPSQPAGNAGRVSVFDRLQVAPDQAAAATATDPTTARPSVFERLQAGETAKPAPVLGSPPTRKRVHGIDQTAASDDASPTKLLRRPAATPGPSHIGSAAAKPGTIVDTVNGRPAPQAHAPMLGGPAPRLQPAEAATSAPPRAAAATPAVAVQASSVPVAGGQQDINELAKLKQQLLKMEAELQKMKAPAGAAAPGPLMPVGALSGGAPPGLLPPGRGLPKPQSAPVSAGAAFPSAATAAAGGEMDRHGVVVQNVHFAATPEVLAAHFGVCGDIERVTIATDPSGRPKGYAYVDFSAEDAVPKAFQLNNSCMLGRTIRVVPKAKALPAAPGLPHGLPAALVPPAGPRPSPQALPSPGPKPELQGKLRTFSWKRDDASAAPVVSGGGAGEVKS